jgi:hypothetical protein
MQSKLRTPLPWYISDLYKDTICAEGASGNPVLATAHSVYGHRPQVEANANAAFICLAVNNHQRLVDMVRELTRVLEICSSTYVENPTKYIKEAQALIQEVEGERG